MTAIASSRMLRCAAVLTAVVAAHGLASAQNATRRSWQEPHAKVLPTGDLEWAPKAFEFQAGESVRYIDFASGNDAADGLSKQTPWKHHPWDPNAGAKASLASRGTVNDGQWHHLMAEADRKAGTFTIYIDGKRDAGGPGLGADASLANDADLYVGGTPQGRHLNGAVEFLRIARGTLADSQTTIEELYAWEFHGPFLCDFTGRKRPDDGGAAGAIDNVPAGQRTIPTAGRRTASDSDRTPHP